MKISINTDLMRIEVYDKEQLISQLDLDMCDEEMLIDNAKEIKDLIDYLGGKNEILFI